MPQTGQAPAQGAAERAMASTWRWAAVGLAVAMCAIAPVRARADSAGAPLLDDPTLIALAVALACSDAPDSSAAAPAPSAREPAAGGPELELVAEVRAKTLRFDEVPKVDVVFHGNGARRTVWKTERVNLPQHPKPGVVYRDVQVRLTVTTDVDSLGEMLGQAKRASKGIRLDDPPAPAPGAAQPRAAPPPMPPPVAPVAPLAPAAPAPPSPAPDRSGAQPR